MIETIESKEEFEKRREKAKAALRAALKGELPLDVVVPVTQEVALVATELPKNSNAKFDKKAYQREYMRKRRAKQKQT